MAFLAKLICESEDMMSENSKNNSGSCFEVFVAIVVAAFFVTVLGQTIAFSIPRWAELFQLIFG